MTILYNLAFIIFAFFSLPVYLFKRKTIGGLPARLGRLPKNLNLENPIWIHAVSVGEAFAMRGIIEGLRLAYPGRKFVISTVTSTGNRIAKTLAKEGDFVTYLPFDLSFVTKKVISKINPCVFVIAETEIWPNLISSLFRNNIPVIIVNARISDKSYRGYLLAKYLLRGILLKVTLFCAQSQRDALRLSSLGVEPDKIIVTGNIKFDQSPSLKFDAAYFRKRLKLNSNEKLLVAGSTHPGEEKIMLEVYKDLLSSHPGIRLLIAPRHPERARQVETLVSDAGFIPQKISLLKDAASFKGSVFILDTVGELVSFYCAADVVFMGKSLVKGGGQNILEPSFAGKPVIFGPLMNNFRDITQLFLDNKAAIMINNAEELKQAIDGLLGNKIDAKALIDNANKVIAINKGATKRNIDLIRNFIVA